MQPANFSTHEFHWVDNGNNDFSCQKNEYFFRVEQMDKNHWWWRVYHNNDAIQTKLNEYATSKYRAIGLCEGVYLADSVMRND